MKLNKTNVIKLREGRKTLKNYVINYILERWDDYENKEEIFLDVKHQGYHSGIVRNLFPYSQTEEFYNKHKREINCLLSETVNNMYKPSA